MMTAAAQAAKEIFCDKPGASDAEKVSPAATAVKKTGVRLQVGFNRGFDPEFRAA